MISWKKGRKLPLRPPPPSLSRERKPVRPREVNRQEEIRKRKAVADDVAGTYKLSVALSTRVQGEVRRALYQLQKMKGAVFSPICSQVCSIFSPLLFFSLQQIVRCDATLD